MNKKQAIFILLLGILAISFSLYWDGSIYNKENDPYIFEVAFNLGIHPDSVTQKQFNQRYFYDANPR